LSDRPLTKSDLNTLLGTTFLQSVQHFDETDSTNGQAIKLLAVNQEVATPCLVYAESQTAGRGRGANRWWSQPGSLTFSVIVDTQKFELTPEQLIKLPLLTGLAVLRTGQSIVDESKDSQNAFQLKWPNDVFLDGRKLAGILIEAPSAKPSNLEHGSKHHAVIGVGLNVNNSWANAPEDLETTGISLADHIGSNLDRLHILRSFLGHLEQLIHSLSNGQSVLDAWPAHCLLTGKRVTLQVGEELISGDCEGLTSNGALRLRTPNGVRQFLSGVVQSWN